MALPDQAQKIPRRNFLSGGIEAIAGIVPSTGLSNAPAPVRGFITNKYGLQSSLELPQRRPNMLEFGWCFYDC